VLPIDVFETIRLGLTNLRLHKMRSSLTALGVIFGVCSVVAMLSIGAGASKEAQDRIAKLGADSIIITSVKPPVEQQAGTQSGMLIEYGITYDDAERLYSTIPGVQVTVPVRQVKKKLWHGVRNVPGVVMATVPWFMQTANVRRLKGRFFTSLDMDLRRNVCIISESVVRDLLPLEEPLGQVIQAGDEVFTVVGVVANRELIGIERKENQEPLSPYQLYVPMTAGRERYPEQQIQREQGALTAERVELHEMTVKVADLKDVLVTAEVIKSTLALFHRKQDYQVEVPQALLEQVKAQQRIWNIVFGAIAGISLVVGGIGIMNIMLASVTERTREIGIRRALGAKKRAITVQFLVETVVLTCLGGLLGLGVGVAATVLVTRFFAFPTIITPAVLVLPFVIAVGVGLASGIYPAQQAANMDPIEALRHE